MNMGTLAATIASHRGMRRRSGGGAGAAGRPRTGMFSDSVMADAFSPAVRKNIGYLYYPC